MPKKKLTDAQVLAAVTAGTTQSGRFRKQTAVVLYNDGRKAIVKWPGARASGRRVFALWSSADTQLYDLAAPLSHGSGKTIHNSSATDPMTAKRLLALVEEHGLDPEFIRPWRPQPRPKPKY